VADRDDFQGLLEAKFNQGVFGKLTQDAINQRKTNERKSTMTPKQRARSGRERTRTLNLRTTEEMFALLEAVVAKAGEGSSKTEIVERGIRAIAAELGVPGGKDAD
jgi:hypothetical protein